MIPPLGDLGLFCMPLELHSTEIGPSAHHAYADHHTPICSNPIYQHLVYSLEIPLNIARVLLDLYASDSF